MTTEFWIHSALMSLLGSDGLFHHFYQHFGYDTPNPHHTVDIVLL